MPWLFLRRSLGALSGAWYSFFSKTRDKPPEEGNNYESKPACEQKLTMLHICPIDRPDDSAQIIFSGGMGKMRLKGNPLLITAKSNA
jgi:hypothetical protein